MNKEEEKRFAQEAKLMALSPKTVSSYQASLKIFFNFHKGKEAQSLCIPELKAFQIHLIEQKYSPHSVNRHMSAIRLLFTF